MSAFCFGQTVTMQVTTTVNEGPVSTGLIKLYVTELKLKLEEELTRSVQGNTITNTTALKEAIKDAGELYKRYRVATRDSVAKVIEVDSLATRLRIATLTANIAKLVNVKTICPECSPKSLDVEILAATEEKARLNKYILTWVKK
jgi:hypothetical protein